MYLIDRLALRVGGEKDTAEEADTVGCCSLRVEHVVLDAGENHLHLNFLGKDSIEYDNTNEIDPKPYQLILKFMKHKKYRRLARAPALPRSRAPTLPRPTYLPPSPPQPPS